MLPKSIEVKVDQYFRVPNPGLKSYFGRVESGNMEEYRTTFYPGRSPTEVLAMWSPKLMPLDSGWPSLFEFEIDLAKKVGPLSIMFPLNERIDDITAYYEGVATSGTPISSSAIAAVLREWNQVRGLVPRSIPNTVEVMKKSTNSGSPYFSRRKGVLALTFPCDVSSEGEHIVQHLPSGDWKSCAVLGWRGQEGGPEWGDVKQRVVWMFPFGINALELTVYQPLIEGAQRNRLVPAWISLESVDQEITKLFDTKGAQDDIVCTDFTKFDQHFGPSCQAAAYQLLDGILSGGKSAKWLKDVFPIKYNIPMMYRYGHIFTGLHGMGSGSGGTNADETLVHRALQYEAAQMADTKLNPHSMCLGDDGVLSYPGITIEQVTSSYTTHGLEMNTAKQYVSKDDCTYLRRWHHKDYRIGGVCAGVYSTNRALGRLCEQERFYDPSKWGPEMVALRQLSIIENCKYHPLRDQFAEFCMAGDLYRLGIDLPGFLDNLDTIVQEYIDDIPDFMGYTKSLGLKPDDALGISSWWIVKYLKSKA